MGPERNQVEVGAGGIYIPMRNFSFRTEKGKEEEDERLREDRVKEIRR
jgi:hypothetical protein